MPHKLPAATVCPEVGVNASDLRDRSRNLLKHKVEFMFSLRCFVTRRPTGSGSGRPRIARRNPPSARRAAIQVEARSVPFRRRLPVAILPDADNLGPPAGRQATYPKASRRFQPVSQAFKECPQ